VVLDVSTEDNRGKNSGIYQMWFFIGVASSSFIGALLTDMFGFRTGQWISVVVIAIAALAWFIFLPETRGHNEVGQAIPKSTDNLASDKLPWKALVMAAFAVFIARFLAWGVLAATAILWLSGIFESGARIGSIFIPIATFTGLYTGLSNLVSVLSTPLAGSISDRYGRRWPVIGLAMILGGLGLWLMSGNIQTLALLGAFLVPIAGSTTETLIPAIAGDRVPKNKRSRALGLINTAGDLGATLGPFAALGSLNSGLLTLDTIYRIGGGLFALVALIVLSPLVSREKTGAITKEPTK